MSLFPNINSDYTFGGKSHTNLVVSEGQAPSEKFIVAKDNAAEPFIYEFGPEGNQTVVLAKGKIVEAGAAEYDVATGRKFPTIKQATEGTNKAIGVLHHSVYAQGRDRMVSTAENNPTVLTRQYIEVPLFEHTTEATAAAYAKAMHFGAAYGVTNALQPGDFVKVGKDGNFVKLNTATDSPFQIVGQVLAAERELPPAGFLQYYLDKTPAELEAMLKAMSTSPSAGAKAGSDALYPEGYPYGPKSWKTEFEKLVNPSVNKGIPFLTDGYFRAKQTVTGIAIDDVYHATTNNDGHVEAVRQAGSATVTGAKVVVGAEDHNSALFIKLRHQIDKGEAEAIAVKYKDTNDAVVTVSSKDVHVDYDNNTVVVYLEAGVTYEDLAIDAKLVVDPVAGIPTEWDYAGSVGAVRILLQR